MKNGPYELVIAPDDYPGKRYRGRYCYEHHLVWWKHTGEVLRAGEVIHHKNEQKRDNRFENLEKHTVASHNTEHAQGPAMVTMICGWCGKEFERQKRHLAAHVKTGRKVFFCSRSCGAKSQNSIAR